MTQWLEAQLILFLARVVPRDQRERAQSMVEYSIIAALIAIVALAAVSQLGSDIRQTFENIAGQLPKGTGGS